jgi:hypothetical protein
MDLPGSKLTWAAGLGLALIAAGAARATPLTVVNVSAPAINCVFNVSCRVTVADTVARFPPSSGYSGRPRLITRTIEGAPGAPAEGFTGYLYRVDFTHAQAETDINCVVWLRLKFGPAARFDYDGSGRSEVFVITSGGVGSVGVSSADKVGGGITLTFTEPVCPANGAAPGQSSFWVGLSSRGAPVASRAKAELTFGGGVVAVKTRTPTLH